ncbi:hypothetical protein GCM10020295_26700 [Streptomyces cinereospinus]
MEAVVEVPVAARPAEGRLLQRPYRGGQEAALEDGYAERALPGVQSRRQSRQGAARAAGERDDVRLPAQFLAECPAAAHRRGVAAAFGDHVRVPGAARAQQGGEGVRVGLAAIGRPVDEVQTHAVGHAPGEGGVERPVGELLAADHSDGVEAEEAARAAVARRWLE